MYEVYANIYQAKTIKKNFEKDLSLNVEIICYEILNKKIRLVILANPNMPTGTIMDEKDKKEFKEFVNKNTKYNPHIMFISKKGILNNFFKDQFKWLFKCEKIFGFSKLRGYDQERLYAYLAERYLSFWFRKYTNFLEWHWTFYEKKK